MHKVKSFHINKNGRGIFKIQGLPDYTVNQGQIILAHNMKHCLFTPKKGSPVEFDITCCFSRVQDWWWGRKRSTPKVYDEIERMEFEEAVVNEWYEDIDW